MLKGDFITQYMAASNIKDYFVEDVMGVTCVKFFGRYMIVTECHCGEELCEGWSMHGPHDIARFKYGPNVFADTVQDFNDPSWSQIAWRDGGCWPTIIDN